MRVLLHACCGPCFLEPYDALVKEHEVEVAYANPNIHPLAEYERRRDVLLEHVRGEGIPVRELPYEPHRWMRAVAGLEDEPDARCRACFELRMKMVAEEAAREGFDAVATTLTVSPYQDADSIRSAGKAAAEAAGIRYLDEDYRSRYSEATRRSREIGMYRQNYCGCLLSDIEASKERAARRAQRAANRGADAH